MFNCSQNESRFYFMDGKGLKMSYGLSCLDPVESYG